MVNDVVTFGEAMCMLIAEKTGDLIDVEKFSRNMAGAETNVAIGLARLGLKSGWVSRLGNDIFGTYIIRTLKQEGVDISNVRLIDSNSTGFLFKSKTLKGDPHVEYFRKYSACSTMSIEDYNEQYFSSFKHLHVTGISIALSQSVKEFAEFAMKNMKNKGKSISFDPNLRLSLWNNEKEMVRAINSFAEDADIILPGISEGKILTGYNSAEDIAKFYLDKGLKVVVVKTGKEGAYYDTGKESGFVPGYKVEKVVDTVGAGDGFAVGVISGLLEKLPITEAVRRGNAIGSLAVMSEGDKDGLPTREQLNRYMSC
ncbi:sugar kinase [Clostridium oryzae]|uniref:2-dehydro-3-deoxygluconokinase n=1 Tax=Clostridium oryzae TaxID=1450648 RepID=A0A1V4IQ59_9CLOT|nr:sugar kinase [Clostridium oryzae]OPJ61944.1 2-dehydro-3-deoxygluconokinase [Clostridium oryzae]